MANYERPFVPSLGEATDAWGKVAYKSHQGSVRLGDFSFGAREKEKRRAGCK